MEGSDWLRRPKKKIAPCGDWRRRTISTSEVGTVESSVSPRECCKTKMDGCSAAALQGIVFLEMPTLPPPSSPQLKVKAKRPSDSDAKIASPFLSLRVCLSAQRGGKGNVDGYLCVVTSATTPQRVLSQFLFPLFSTGSS